MHVARYGPAERRILSGARRIFVRDAATAADLRAHGVPAEAPGNVIVDLLASDVRIEWQSAVRLVLLPGSRDRAYADAGRIAALVAELRRRGLQFDAILSIAPNLDAARFAPALELGGVRPWAGPLGALLPENAIVVDEAVTTGRGFFAPTKMAAPHDWLSNMGGSIGIGMPLRDRHTGLDLSSYGLVELSSEERHGFLWVVLRGDHPIDVAAHLGELDDEGFATIVAPLGRPLEQRTTLYGRTQTVGRLLRPVPVGAVPVALSAHSAP